MDHAGPPHAWNMARSRIYPVEVPAGLVRLRIVVDEETATVFLGEDPGEPPRRARQISAIEQINDQQIVGLIAFDAGRTTQITILRQIDIANIVCAVVVKDLPARPVEALDAKFSTRLERFHHGNIWMPAIVSRARGIFRRPL